MKKLLDIGICSAVLVSGAVCNDQCSMQFDCAGRWIWRQRAPSCVARRVDLSIRNTSVRPWRKAAQPRGSLTNLGTGQLLRQRPTIFAGGTTMSADTLAAGDISHFSATLGGGPVSVALGANLGGSGSVVGDVANNGVTAGTSESWYLRNSAAAAPAVAPTQPSTAAGPATPGAPAGAPVATSPGTPDGEFSRHAHGHAARDRCTAGRLGVRVQPTFNSAGMTWQPYARVSILRAFGEDGSTTFSGTTVIPGSIGQTAGQLSAGLVAQVTRSGNACIAGELSDESGRIPATNDRRQCGRSMEVVNEP